MQDNFEVTHSLSSVVAAGMQIQIDDRNAIEYATLERGWVAASVTLVRIVCNSKNQCNHEIIGISEVLFHDKN